MGQKVFVCHSSSDKDLANQVCRDLEDEGLTCWIAPRDVTPGSQWAAELANAIDDCGVFLLIFTNSSNDSDQCIREVERAVRRRKVIVNYRSDNVPCSSALDYYLAVHQWFDPTGSVDDDMKRLAVHLQRVCAAAAAGVTAPPPPKAQPVYADAGASKQQSAGPQMSFAAAPQPAPAPPRAAAELASLRITIPAPGYATMPGLSGFYKSMSSLPFLNSMASVSIDGALVQRMPAVTPVTIERRLRPGDHRIELKLRMQPPRIYVVPFPQPGEYEVRVGRSSWTGNYAKQCQISCNGSAPVTVWGKSRFSLVRAIVWCIAALWFLGVLMSAFHVQ